MFLVRSAFWLTAAFIAMHPHNVDIGKTASAISGQAIAAGQQLVVGQILQHDCSLAGCTPVAAPAVASVQLASVTSPHVSAIRPQAEDATPLQPAPFPRMRPAWMS